MSLEGPHCSCESPIPGMTHTMPCLIHGTIGKEEYDKLMDESETFRRVQKYAHDCVMLRMEPSTRGLRDALEGGKIPPTQREDRT